MADNVTLDAGSGGSVIATDDISNVHYPITKIGYGALDSVNLVTSISTNPFPVALSDADNAVLDTINTAVEKIDDAVFVDDAAFTLGSSSGIMMMGFAGTQSVNANDAAALACETDGALHIHDGGNIITVDGTVIMGAGIICNEIKSTAFVTMCAQFGFDQVVPAGNSQ